MRTRLAKLMTKAAREPHRLYPHKTNKGPRILDKTRELKAILFPQASWLVVMTAPRRENDAIAALLKEGHLAWHPQSTVYLTSYRHQIKTKVNRSLFPRYIFATRNPNAEKAIPDCDHVSFVVGDVPRARPGLPSLLEILSDKQQAGEFDGTITQPLHSFKRGEQVRVNDESAFHGLNAIIERTEGERVLVLLNLLGGSTRVEIDPRRLSAA